MYFLNVLQLMPMHVTRNLCNLESSFCCSFCQLVLRCQQQKDLSIAMNNFILFAMIVSCQIEENRSPHTWTIVWMNLESSLIGLYMKDCWTSSTRCIQQTGVRVSLEEVWSMEHGAWSKEQGVKYQASLYRLQISVIATEFDYAVYCHVWLYLQELKPAPVCNPSQRVCGSNLPALLRQEGILLLHTYISLLKWPCQRPTREIRTHV